MRKYIFARAFGGRENQLMPRPARSAQEIGAVRESILRHATEIMAEEGYAGLSMYKIAARMSMSAANIYNYFLNKEHIFLEVHDRAFNSLYGYLKDNVTAQRDGLLKVKRLIEAYIEFGVRNKSYYEIMFCTPTPKFSDYKGTAAEEVAGNAKRHSMRILDLALQVVSEFLSSRGDTNATEARVLTMQAWATMHGLVSLYNNRTLGEADPAPRELMREVVARIIGPWVERPAEENMGVEIEFEDKEEDHGL
jgi:AcrR family transcriptional regulator